MIPKNSRVQINRVVRNIGPALAGGFVTLTHQENEHLNSIKLKNEKMLQQMKLQQQQIQSAKREPAVVNQHENNLLNEISTFAVAIGHSEYTQSPMIKHQSSSSPSGDTSVLYSDILNDDQDIQPDASATPHDDDHFPKIENTNDENSSGSLSNEILNNCSSPSVDSELLIVIKILIIRRNTIMIIIIKYILIKIKFYNFNTNFNAHFV